MRYVYDIKFLVTGHNKLFQRITEQPFFLGTKNGAREDFPLIFETIVL